MTHRDSSYYPRRAGIFSPVLKRADACGSILTKLAFQVPKDVTLLGLVGGLLVPGLAFYLRKPDRSGQATLAVCAVLVLVFLAFIGFPMANAVFALLLTIHVVGLLAYCRPILAGTRWLFRLLATLLVTGMTIGLVYLPLQTMLEHRLLIPLRLHGHVVVVHCLGSPGVIRPGDWIAFRVSNSLDYFNDGRRHGNVIIADGINLAPVLAVPGNKVEFDSQTFSVNGISQPRRDNMPTSGGWTVPENCWFVWPELGIAGHGSVPEANVVSAVMEIATVHRDQFVGKAFRHWFGRPQLFL